MNLDKNYIAFEDVPREIMLQDINLEYFSLSQLRSNSTTKLWRFRREIKKFEQSTCRQRQIVQTERKLNCQVIKVLQFQQQIKELQQQSRIIKEALKKEIKNTRKDLSNNNEEISCPRNHNKNLLAEVKKLKNEKVQQKIKKQLINKETLIVLVEIGHFSKVKIQTMDKVTVRLN